MVFENPLSFVQKNDSSTPKASAGRTFGEKLTFHSSAKSAERRIVKNKLQTSLGFNENRLDSPCLFDYS